VSEDRGPSTPFGVMDDYLRIPRVLDLVLSPSGDRLVATVCQLDADGHTFRNALWAIDPSGADEPRRLTWSEKGESAPVFTPDGSLLFRSNRVGEDDDPPALWRLPDGVGEARKVLTCAGGVGAVTVARDAGTVLVVTPRFPDSADDSADNERRKARKDAKVGAVLYESSPVRYWDKDLGPDAPHLLVVPLDVPDDQPDDQDTTRDLTPQPGMALFEQSVTITPDGRTAVTGWSVPDTPGYDRSQLVAIDVADGTLRVLVADPDVHVFALDISPDGRTVVCLQETDPTIEAAPRLSLCLVDVETAQRALVPDSDVWAVSAVFSADGTAVYLTADDHGHCNIFRADVASGRLDRVTRTGHYTSVCVAPDGVTLYALRDAVDSPPTPVRIDATGVDGDPEPLPAPGRVAIPGRLEDVAVTVADGTTVRSWLALPPAAAQERPAPLVLWMHGGPVSSWNCWSWRWNPWQLTAKGYAVLLPDPALSTGYGQPMIQRGWGQWGGAPYTDLMTVTDHVVARADIDAERTAAMGGSYGGYLANWVAGHTDRFRCIVTHASIWALEQFQGTTDGPAYWAREWGLPGEVPEQYATWSPHLFVDAITTPMLVIHGDKDYRVPVGEGLRLWWDLQRRGVESKYLYFPDEGHWVLKPDNARIWYETVWAWLAAHVLGEEWERPALL
jgi:dipeptidyl aminopeptidase/acylaminoacyl peptidase